MEASSGRYYTITTGRDDNRDSNSNDRPPGVPRNSAVGPRYLNFDFNISKAVFFGVEHAGTPVNVNLFANVRNAFNRTHYNTPSGVMTSPNFGRSTSADDPREIEMGIRFQF
jgi:outer membrane receptor protein involved in Fe transport